MEKKEKKDFYNKLKLDRIKAYFNRRKFKRGSLASCITILVIAAIVLLNVVTSVCAEKFPLSWDLTSNKVFTLTDQSKNFLNALDKDVEITLLNDENSFSDKNEYFKQANTVLKQYAKLSSKVKINYVDVVKNPTYIQNNYPNENLNTNSIIVRCQNKYKVITINDIFDISYNYYGGSGVTASKAEQELTAAIVYVTFEQQNLVAIVKGYGEQDYSAFSEVLKKNNYNIVEVSILTEDIPESADAVLIFAPERDYDNTGKEKLEKFLNLEGKTLFYAANPQLSSSPVLDKILESWDIKLKSGLVYETNKSKLTTNMNLFEAVSEYVDNNYTENLKSVDIPVLVPACRPIEVLNSSDKVKTLLQFSETSGIMPINAGKDFDIKANISGPIASCVVSSKTLDGKSKENHVAVIGSYIALSEDYLSATSLNNSQYFVNMLNVMLDRENVGIIIESKSLESKELGINAVQANLLGVIFTVVVPLLVLSLGIAVFVKRKNK